MDERIREQYILWTRAAGRSCNDPAEAEAFAGGFAWAVALHDAAMNTAQITAPRLEHIAKQLRDKRDALFYEAERTRDGARFDRCRAAAEAYGHAYRLIVPMEKEPNPRVRLLFACAPYTAYNFNIIQHFRAWLHDSPPPVFHVLISGFYRFPDSLPVTAAPRPPDV